MKKHFNYTFHEVDTILTNQTRILRRCNKQLCTANAHSLHHWQLTQLHRSTIQFNSSTINDEAPEHIHAE